MKTNTGDETGLSVARVLVTGGTQGIGAATVRRLAAAGAEVVAAARTAPDPGGLGPGGTGLGGTGPARFVAADVATADGVAALAEPDRGTGHPDGRHG